MSELQQFFASCPKGIEDLLLNELQSLGVQNSVSASAGVSFQGDLTIAYKVCLWSRLASRVLLLIKTFAAKDDDELYRQIQTVKWSDHVNMAGTLAVNCHVSHSAITNSHYAALKVKDAIVDQFVELFEQRPSVDRDNPDIRINLYIHRDQASLSIDLSGESLHKRGFRKSSVTAPMKENLAAAVLMRSGWPNESMTLVDLMCGSGTILIEAALMALNIAPGVERQQFGFTTWKGHDHAAWQSLLSQAQQQKKQSLKTENLIIRGYDQDASAVKAARQNIQAAGLDKYIKVEIRSIDDCVSNNDLKPGLVIVNPPYGERLGEEKELAYLYAEIGNCWKRYFGEWCAALFTGNINLATHVGLRSHKDNTLYNGAIKCKLFQYKLRPAKPDHLIEKEEQAEIQAKQMFANRLTKNYKHLSKWAKRNNIECYRVYDADLPEFSAAIDIYVDWVHVQEYEAPATIDIRKARQRLNNIMSVIPDVLKINESHIILKTRRQQKGIKQYEKQSDQKHFHVIHENELEFYINLEDYLDTGLFLDHRLTREMIRTMSKDKDVLNLFAYTGSVSIYAAAGGARSVTTVDMSNTYLDWARRNFKLNRLNGDHYHFIKADCIKWLIDEKNSANKYDLIFLDPPTFSNSKSMENNFDVQKDHVFLIYSAMKLLNRNGSLIFSNNFRKFRLDQSLLNEFDVEDISLKTIPEDFKRNQKIHNCWKISHK
ncbi:MAG: bifunctional 23S rRNA (guanine(2069)-N(7))-methyltransferase RlmK/23S rRNA (guanine(2445)-N(2))-methyltransferase RlmL [Gammaproteobacteria bacterium]|nr:bifunctional 23S rRNA (guanine(2069)-N(7))-methyltransferase RlmK/23S rRNA (guanine(2445)-N(2))-methyltransferase RlmL [Gammaproteobacteria bacterium]